MKKITALSLVFFCLILFSSSVCAAGANDYTRAQLEFSKVVFYLDKKANIQIDAELRSGGTIVSGLPPSKSDSPDIFKAKFWVAAWEMMINNEPEKRPTLQNSLIKKFRDNQPSSAPLDYTYYIQNIMMQGLAIKGLTDPIALFVSPSTTAFSTTQKGKSYNVGYARELKKLKNPNSPSSRIQVVIEQNKASHLDIVTSLNTVAVTNLRQERKSGSGCFERVYSLAGYQEFPKISALSYFIKLAASAPKSGKNVGCGYQPSQPGLVPNSAIKTRLPIEDANLLKKYGNIITFSKLPKKGNEKEYVLSTTMHGRGGSIEVARGDKYNTNPKSTALWDIRDARVNVSKKDATTQEVDYAKFVVFKPDGIATYFFEYRGRIYSYENVKDGSLVVFSPQEQKFTLGSGKLTIKDSQGKAMRNCEFNGGLKYKLDIQKNGCKIVTMWVLPGTTYSHQGVLEITPPGNTPIAFFTDEKAYKAYLKEHPNGPAILLLPGSRPGTYIVESKGIVQYKHLNTLIRTTRRTTETTFHIHNPANTLWVRNGQAIVEKGGASIIVTSTQRGGNCLVNVVKRRIRKAVTETTEALIIGGSVMGGECKPKGKAKSIYMLSPSGILVGKGKKGVFSGLTFEDRAVLNGQLPIGIPLQNRVNGLVTVIDMLIKIKWALAKKYNVDLIELNQFTLWERTKGIAAEFFWTPSDLINYMAPACNVNKEKANRKNFGLYLQSTVWGLRDLKQNLLKGINPDTAINNYCHSLFTNPSTGKLKKHAGATQMTCQLLKLVDANGQIAAEDAIKWATKFRKEGEKCGGWWSFDFLKHDFYAQYYLLMDIGITIFKLKPIDLGGGKIRSIDFDSEGRPTYSWQLHTTNLLGPTVDTPCNGALNHIGWSGNLKNDVIINAGRSGNVCLRRPETTKGGVVNIKKVNIQSTGTPLGSEIQTLEAMEKIYPTITTFGKLYDEAFNQKTGESVKGFFAQWVDPFLIVDAAFLLGKVAIRSVRAYRAISTLRLAESLDVIRYTGRSKTLAKITTALEVMRRGEVGSLRGFELISGCAAKICFLKDLAEVKKSIRTELGSEAEEQFSKSIDDAVKKLDNLEQKGVVKKGKPTEGHLIVSERSLGNVHPMLSMTDLLKNAEAGHLPGLIKFGEKNGLTILVDKSTQQKVNMYFVRKAEMETYAQFFEKTELGYYGLTNKGSKPYDMIIVVPDELVEEAGNSLASKIKSLIANGADVKTLSKSAKNRERWRRLRATAMHEYQHSHDFVSGHVAKNNGVLEGRAFVGSFKRVPDQDALPNFRRLAAGGYPKDSPHRMGQIDVLAEFIYERGIPGQKYSCGLQNRLGMNSADFVNQVRKIKGSDELYKKLREDALLAFKQGETIAMAHPSPASLLGQNALTPTTLKQFGADVLANYWFPI